MCMRDFNVAAGEGGTTFNTFIAYCLITESVIIHHN